MKLVIALLIANINFQPREYHETRNALEKKGFKVITISNRLPGMTNKHATAVGGEQVPVDFWIDEFNLSKCNAIYLIGGGGALTHLSNEAVHKLLQEAKAIGMPYGAICISPRILLEAGVLNGVEMTGWDGDPKKPLKPLADKYGATYLRKPVVHDGLVITATGPDAAAEFGRTIAKALLERSAIPQPLPAKEATNQHHSA